jgi:hypothetical protein
MASKEKGSSRVPPGCRGRRRRRVRSREAGVVCTPRGVEKEKEEEEEEEEAPPSPEIS